MNTAKEEILSRIRQSTKDVPGNEKPEDVHVERDYLIKLEGSQAQNVELFAERVSEYKATVARININELKEHITASCKNQNVRSLVIPDGIPEEFLPDDVELLFDSEGPLSHHQLDESDGVLTTCRLAVAQTGTILLDGGPGQGRRALTLVPDYHLCIVWEDQIVSMFPEAVREMDATVKNYGPAITLISGPSATSDIELNRVEGVHGPRRLEVLIVAR